MYLVYSTMSIITTLSIKDKNKSKYSAMRNWLSQRQLSMGDYIIEKWDDEFSVKVERAGNEVAFSIKDNGKGFNMDEARKLIQCLKGKNVIGGDVACLMPTKDSPNQITAMVAASIMFEIICLISVYRNK